MLSSAKIGTSLWRYYTDSVACAATEYYLGAGEAQGRWFGRGLEALGLTPGSVVSEAQLESLFARALHPVTGERLGRAWRVDGVTGFDLTLSAPKSVSSLWALADPDTAAQLRAAHAAAVEAALSYLDRHASWSRRGVDGTEQAASGGLAVALFEHRTSRCADPQLHTHALVVNKVLCADGVWRTIDATELYGHKKSAGMVYQAALRDEIHARTGLVFEMADSNGQAELIGVPDGLLKLWSKRTTQIGAEASRTIDEYENSMGRSLTSDERAAVTKTAVLKTRPAKTVNDAGTLQSRWYAEATGAGFDPGEVVHAVREAAREQGRQASRQPLEDLDVAAGAVRAAAATRAVFSRADVAGQVAAGLPVDARGAAAVLASVQALTDKALGLDGAVPVGDQRRGLTARASDARWAGAEVLAAEARVMSLAERGRAGGYAQVDTACLVVAMNGDGGLDLGQYRALQELVGGGDFLSVLTAPAGAGKTRALGSAAAAWQRAGYEVVGLAPSARAAAELSTATGVVADTLAKWILEQNSPRWLRLLDERARYVLDYRSVVLVDEASMANTHDLDRLVTTAAGVGAKVVLVGDPAQIGVVRGPGGLLAALTNAGHAIALERVHRFTQDWEADASMQLRRGDPDVLDTYHRHDRLHAHADADGAVEALHARWRAEDAAGRRVLMMARTRADVEALNTRARASATELRQLYGPVVRIGERDWQAGDLLRARRNDRTLPVGTDGYVRNGDRYRVLAATEAGLHVVKLDHGGEAFLPAAFVAAHAEYGWATTVTAAQGATVDVGLVLVRPGIDREHLYVAMTRGREANHAFIACEGAGEFDRHAPIRDRTGRGEAFDVLAAALARSGAQDAAHTVRDQARTRTVETARKAADEAARRSANPEPPWEHVARAAELRQREADRENLAGRLDQWREGALAARKEWAATSSLRPGKRRDLSETIRRHHRDIDAALPELAALDRQILPLSRQVADDNRAREADRRARAARPVRPPRHEPELEPACPAELIGRTAQLAAREPTAHRADEELRAIQRNRRPAHDHSRGRGRDGPGIDL